MQKYRDNVTIVGRGGLVPVRNATATVYVHGTTSKAVIYSNAERTPKANPFQADSLGVIAFYAENGHYDILVQGEGQEIKLTDVLMEDVYEDVDALNVQMPVVRGIAESAQVVAEAAVPKPDLANTTDPAKGAAMVGYRGRPASEKLMERVSPEDFGSGQAAWEAMLQALHTDPEFAGVRQIEAKGTYTFTSPLSVHITRNDLTIDGCGSGVLDLSGMPQDSQSYLFRVLGGGPTGVASEVTSNIVRSVRQSTNYIVNVASTAGFAAGDYVTITSIGRVGFNTPGEYFMGITGMSGFTPRWKGFVNRVARVVNATQLALEWGPVQDMDAVKYLVTVRAVNLTEGFAIRNFARVFGGVDEVRLASGSVGAGLLRAEYTAGVEVSGNRLEAIGGNCCSSVIGVRHVAHNNTARNVHQGWNFHGIDSAVSINNVYSGGRRFYNTDASPINFLTGNNWEVVHTTSMLSLGGSSENAHTGPGGHYFQDMLVSGHEARDVNVGINCRGVGLSVTGCSLRADIGIGAGYDGAGANDPTGYAEVPNMDYLYVDSSTHIVATTTGVLLSSSINNGRISANIVARYPVRTWAKYQDNLVIDGDLEGNASDSIGVYAQAALRLSNWHIRQTNFRNLYQGMQVNTPAEDSPNILVDGCLFDNVEYRFVRFNSSLRHPNTGVINCRHTTAPTGDPLSGFKPSGAGNAYEYNNTWQPRRDYVLVEGGSITVDIPKPTASVYVVNGASNVTLTSIAGGVLGRQITLKRSGTGTVTLNSSANLKVPGGSVSLASDDDTLLLTCLGPTSGWVVIGGFNV